MRQDKFEIWITLENDHPDLEDINKAQIQLIEMGINYEGKLGIGFTRMQWANFLKNLTRFEEKFATATPATVLGFPVRMIEERT